jgi:hypothetical protein
LDALVDAILSGQAPASTIKGALNGTMQKVFGVKARLCGDMASIGTARPSPIAAVDFIEPLLIWLACCALALAELILAAGVGIGGIGFTGRKAHGLDLAGKRGHGDPCGSNRELSFVTPNAIDACTGGADSFGWREAKIQRADGLGC